ASVISPTYWLGLLRGTAVTGCLEQIPVSLSSPPVDRLCNELALISTQPLTARQMLNIKHQQ
ncbi:TPA: hypothetical protein ACPZC4_005334, partial [Escherichia coli]